MNRIQFWLSWNNGAERLQLPVNPEVIQVSTAREHTDVNVSELGEYTVINKRNLDELSFASFFPRDYNPVYCEYIDIPRPWVAVQTIERWWDSENPIRLTVTGTPLNKAVTIRRFTYNPEQAGNPGDIFFNISFKEYRFLTVEKLKTEEKQDKTTVKSVSKRVNEIDPPTSYTVQSGDTLSQIALRQKSKGNDVTWQEIYEANKDVIGKNPNLILPGQELVIP